jgi:hypothetical protein
MHLPLVAEDVGEGRNFDSYLPFLYLLHYLKRVLDLFFLCLLQVVLRDCQLQVVDRMLAEYFVVAEDVDCLRHGLVK